MLRDALLSEVIARDVSLSFWERVKSYARKTRGDWGESERTLFPSLDSPRPPFFPSTLYYLSAWNRLSEEEGRTPSDGL